jgi:hypothetical protein
MGNLNNIIVGGKNSYSNSGNFSFDDTFAVRKNNPYFHLHHSQDIFYNTKFILNHFQKPLFPRTISTFRTRGKQVIV